MSSRRQAATIALWYAGLGAVWIFFSGLVLHALVKDPATAAWLENAKGWFYVVATAALLGLVLDRYFRVLREAVLRSQDAQQRLEFLGDNLPDSYVYHYSEGEGGAPRFHYVSAGVERIHGVTAEQVLRDAHCLSEQVEPGDRDSSISKEVESARTLTDLFSDIAIRRPDGKVRRLQIRSRPRRGPDGKIEWFGLTSDVTKLRQAELEAEAGRDRLKLFIEHAPGAVAMFDLEMRYLAVSPRWLVDFRVGAVDLVGRCHYDVFPELPSAIKAIHRRAMLGEVIRGGEDRFERADGSVQWLTWEVHPWRVDADTIGGIIIFSEDVTERRRTSEALRESEAEFRAMFEVASIGMAQADPNTGQFLRVNRKMCEISGYSEAELRSMGVSALTHPDDREGDWRCFQDVVAGKAPSYQREKRYVRKDGAITWVNVNMTVFRGADGKPIRTVATIEDITGRRQAEEERLRLAAAMEQAAESICITDTKARILYVNPAFERTTGFSRQEVLGETPGILKSGKQDAKFYQEMWAVLASGKVWRGHFINKRKDGALFEEEAAISPVRDQAGVVTNYVAIKLDVTREMALEQQVRQVQKLEAIGQLAGGVAHDFNNILAVILMQTEQALEESEGTPAVASLAEIKKAAERASSLTRQLLLFSRRQVMQATVLDVNEVVTNLAKMLQRILGEDVQLRIELHGRPLWIRADAGMIDQVLMNLSVNARDAMPNGGRLTVTTGEEVFHREVPERSPRALAGSYCRLVISDDGCGIAPDALPKIFEPFFTTKEPGKGTGLGLATVYGIVEQHKGWIEVSTQVGRGTEFRIFLPTIPADSPRVEVAPRTRPRGGNETILLVEDDPEVRKITQTILVRYGYHVLSAGNGPEAMSALEGAGRRIDLLLTDMVLPEGMHGLDVASAIRGAVPSVKIIFISGYSPELAGRALDLRPGEAFLQKPFELDGLLTLVRRCLDTRP
jgi:two-component system, cell cycle sensor histidine kinase and response regulator CckA